MPLGLLSGELKLSRPAVPLCVFNGPFAYREIVALRKLPDRWRSWWPAFAAGVDIAGMDDPMPAIEKDDPLLDRDCARWVRPDLAPVLAVVKYGRAARSGQPQRSRLQAHPASVHGVGTSTGRWMAFQRVVSDEQNKQKTAIKTIVDCVWSLDTVAAGAFGIASLAAGTRSETSHSASRSDGGGIAAGAASSALRTGNWTNSARGTGKRISSARGAAARELPAINIREAMRLKVTIFAAGFRSATLARKLVRIKKVESGEPGWQASCWLLERQDPARYARPEVMLQYRLQEAGLAGVTSQKQILDDLVALGYNANRRP